MKVFNIVALALGGAIFVSMGIATLTGIFLEHSLAMPVTIALSLLIGFNARRTVEKLLGYTLEEAMKEGRDEPGS